MKRLHPEPFAKIKWSTSTVYAETMAAAARNSRLLDEPERRLPEMVSRLKAATAM